MDNLNVSNIDIFWLKVKTNLNFIFTILAKFYNSLTKDMICNFMNGVCYL